MMYLTAVFLSPLYFILARKWGAFALNSAFYSLALLLLVTIFLSFLAPIPWIIAAVHAIMDYRRRLVDEDTTMLAQKMADAMRQPSSGAP